MAIELTSEMLRQFTRIADALERMANGGEPTAPDMRRPIEDYRTFDWSGMGASVINADKDGPTHIEYAGTIWTRRSPSNKFDPAIWFSRAAGKDDEGNVKYLRLITFASIKGADPVNPKAIQAAGNAPAAEKPAPKVEPSVDGRPTPKAASIKVGNMTLGERSIAELDILLASHDVAASLKEKVSEVLDWKRPA